MDSAFSGDDNQAFIRSQMDEILAREIVALIDVDSNAAMMSFNLGTISCVTMIVEREREIKQYSDFPPERYTRESFVSELVDIGLDDDDYLASALNLCLKSGYISCGENEEFRAEMPAFMMAGFLDSMFPGMQGLNLIAFVLQMHEEVSAGRKSLELAKQSFEASLKTRGVSVSKDRAAERATEMASGVQKIASEQSRRISAELKQQNLDRLSKLIKTRKKRGAEFQEKVKIQDVFDKGPTKEEIEAQEEEIRQAEEAARKSEELARQLAEKDEKIKAAEKTAQELETQLKALEEKEKALEAAREEARIAREKAAALEVKNALIEEKEARLKEMEARLQQMEAMTRQQNGFPRKEAPLRQNGGEDDLEARIAAFESDLAMPCPLCRTGKVEERTTEKGKSFYACTDPDCRFVTWDKPYHFNCPLCKNPFLTEMMLPDGGKGLKCPRAACAYTQPNLLDPMQSMAAGAEPAKKKKRLVRRKKRT